MLKCLQHFMCDREFTLPDIHVLSCNDLEESEYSNIIDTVARKLKTTYSNSKVKQHEVDGTVYDEYSLRNEGGITCDSEFDKALIVILGADQNTFRIEHLQNIKKEVEIDNAIAVIRPKEDEGSTKIISSYRNPKIQQVLVDLLWDPDGNKLGHEPCREMQPILDCNTKVFLAGIDDTTLSEVKRVLSHFISESCLHEIHIPKRSEVKEKLSKLDDNSVVICCVQNTARLIIISKTEPDEVGHIVKTAEKKCGQQKVMVLLCGHKDLQESDQQSWLYNKGEFDEDFFKKQRRLDEKANGEKNFLSMNWTLSEKQIEHIREWVKKCNKNLSSL